MFRDYINNPIDPIPVEYIKTLTRIYNEPDYSLTCLGIALLKPRMENYEGIGGTYENYSDESTCVDEFIERGKQNNDYPTFCYYMYNSGNNDEAKTRLKDAGYSVKENIGAFIKSKGNVDCLAVYNAEKNVAGIFINTRSIQYYHLIISFISLLFPNLFKVPLKKPEEYDIITSLSKTDKKIFVQKIQEAVAPYSLEFKRLMLSGMLKALHADKIDAALRDVNLQRSNIDIIQTQLSDAIKKLKDMIVTYEGLKVTESYDGPEEELVEYLSNNKMIYNMKIDGTKLSFCVATLLNNYNESAWETFNKRGYIYDGEYTDHRTKVDLLPAFKDKANRKILFNSIFVESPEFAVKIAGNYTVNLHDCRITARKDYDYEEASPIFSSYLPNPHLKLFSCLGGYEHRVIKALRDRNYIGAIEMCCASAGSVDLDETEQTFRPFLGWIMSSREKILRRKDGVDMTPEEALVYLIDKEKEE